MAGGKHNPRSANGHRRRQHRERFRAMNAPCGICGGRFGPIRYDHPSDARHPLSFVIDEIRPISRYAEFGYESREMAARDWDNLQAAHWMCNAAKGAHVGGEKMRQMRLFVPDGDW